MAMGVGGKKGGPQADINMTPMIDVLLVLLIIFMVVQQGLQRGLSVQVPPPADDRPQTVAPENLVLELCRHYGVRRIVLAALASSPARPTPRAPPASS